MPPTTNVKDDADTTSGATDIVSRIITFAWDNSVAHAFYLISFKDNLESLKSKIRQLTSLKTDVERRIELNEANQLTRLAVVDDWLHRVEAFVKEVNVLLISCEVELGWLQRYSLGKEVFKKLKIVAGLSSHGDFSVVADKSLPRRVDFKYESQTVGMNEILEEVWSWMEDDEVKIIGIHGVGGVGKTTLLKKINNAFAQKGDTQSRRLSTIYVVIWVVVSKNFSMQNIQKEIGKRLGLAWSEDDDQNDKAQRILNVLSEKKFVVLFDDIWEPMDLEAIGIPPPHYKNSKILFTTRSEEVCGDMDVDKKFKVPILDWGQAWTLFQQKLGREALNAHLEIPQLAEAVARECRGLPLALITIGRAMSTKKTPHEWNHARSRVRQYANEFSVIENGFSKQLCLKIFPGESSAINAIEVDNVILPSEVFSKQDHKLYCTVGWGFSGLFRNDCISGAIKASSTDRFPEESIHNTLDPRDRIDGTPSYWSSEGSEVPEKCETLTYRLISQLCLITEINIRPFQVYFERGAPICSAKAVRFRMGHLNSLEESYEWTYVSPLFRMSQENSLQKFKLPYPVLCIGGSLQVELLDMVHKYISNKLFYIGITHVQVVGQTLLPGFEIKYTHHQQKCVVSYTPQGDNDFQGA